MAAWRQTAGTRVAYLLLGTALGAPIALHAQRRTTTDASGQLPRDGANVRAELAGVLLQSKKYDDAAREYRALLARDSANVDYRVNLARALAWGGRPREAERELQALQAKKLRVATVDTLLRAAREAMEPRQWEAAAWVAERGEYAPYRLAYARALVRERFYSLAVAQYDTLLGGAGIGPAPAPAALRREQAFAYLDAGESDVAAARLRDVLRLTPADTGVRHVLAVTLADLRRRVEARAQYDTLLSAAPTAGLLTERGQLRLAMLDTSGAQSDLLASIPLGGGTPALLLLGDVYRERGQFAPARAMYRMALARDDLGASRMRIRSAIAQMARDERPVAAFAPTVGDDPGWRVSTVGIGDNLGVHYAASTIQRTIALGKETRAGVAVLHQYLGERSDVRSIDLTVVGAEGSLSSGFAYGPFLGRTGVSAGGLRLPQARAIPVASATVAAWVSAWELAVEGSAAPAYSSLFTTTALRAADDQTRNALTEQSATVTLGGPVRSLDIAVSEQTSRLNDGNRRTTLQGYARYPLTAGVFAVYSASRMTFSRRSLRYWDPFEYTAHAAGIELAPRPHRGLSAALRALPGKAWSVEPPPVELRTPRRGSTRLPERIHHSAVQITTSGELAWRDPHWEGTAAVSYGQGRVGDYRRLGINLAVRVMP